jgi:hypothetical protein
MSHCGDGEERFRLYKIRSQPYGMVSSTFQGGDTGGTMPVSLIPVEAIEQIILLIRGQKIIIDADLARLYGVTTKALNQAVRRNAERFPEDFVFQLTSKELSELVTDCDRFINLKHSMALPHAFTEHGAIMAANVLSSKRAVEASIYVVRAFVKLRQQLVSHTELALKLDLLEQKIATHDKAICSLFDAIRNLMTPWPPQGRPPKPSIKHPIGFVVGEE